MRQDACEAHLLHQALLASLPEYGGRTIKGNLGILVHEKCNGLVNRGCSLLATVFDQVQRLSLRSAVWTNEQSHSGQGSQLPEMA